MPSKDERRERKQAKRDRKRATLLNQAVVEGLGGGAGAVVLGGELARVLIEVGVTAAGAQFLGPMLAMGLVIPAISRVRDWLTPDPPEAKELGQQR